MYIIPERQVLFLPKRSFRGGAHPLRAAHGGKLETRNEPIRDYVPKTVVLPMNMHIGAPARPCVAVGERVRLGQVVGEPAGPQGLPVHASVAGTVSAVEERPLAGNCAALCVCIENDLSDERMETFGLGGAEELDPARAGSAIREAGILGMGGAGFPTHAKLMFPKGKHCDTIIINGAECETFLTADYRLMFETPARVVDGLRILMRTLGVARGVIAIEDNKPEAIEAVRDAAYGRAGVEVFALRTKYPQGGEKQLIEAVTGREVPSCKLPIDAHTLVFNAATAAAVSDALVHGRPLTERIATVTGCVKRPANLRVRIGTPIGELIEACGGFTAPPGKILLGGGLTGLCAPDENAPVTKTVNGVVVLDEQQAQGYEEEPCIRCARCVAVCPAGLRPYLMKYACDAGDFDAARALDVLDCILCGACSYICPARRSLTSSFKLGRDGVIAQRRKRA